MEVIVVAALMTSNLLSATGIWFVTWKGKNMWKLWPQNFVWWCSSLPELRCWDRWHWRSWTLRALPTRRSGVWWGEAGAGGCEARIGPPTWNTAGWQTLRPAQPCRRDCPGLFRPLCQRHPRPPPKWGWLGRQFDGRPSGRWQATSPKVAVEGSGQGSLESNLGPIWKCKRKSCIHFRPCVV